MGAGSDHRDPRPGKGPGPGARGLGEDLCRQPWHRKLPDITVLSGGVTLDLMAWAGARRGGPGQVSHTTRTAGTQADCVRRGRHGQKGLGTGTWPVPLLHRAMSWVGPTQGRKGAMPWPAPAQGLWHVLCPRSDCHMSSAPPACFLNFSPPGSLASLWYQPGPGLFLGAEGTPSANPQLAPETLPSLLQTQLQPRKCSHCPLDMTCRATGCFGSPPSQPLHTGL